MGRETTPQKARTVLPSNTFDKYVYTFTRAGENTGVVKTPDSEGFFTLETGNYTVAVQVYIGTEEPFTLVASGVSSTFNVGPGSNAPVEVLLTEVNTGGQGHFNYTITYPAGATGTTVLQKWPEMDIVTLSPENLTQGNGQKQSLQLDAGSYLLTVIAVKDERYTGISEAIHIHSSLPTNYTKNFDDSDLIEIVPPPDAPTNVSVEYLDASSSIIRWSGVPGADEYTVYRSSSMYGDYSLIGKFTNTINTYNYMLDRGGLSEGTTYWYTVSASNENGESFHSSPVWYTTPPGVPVNVKTIVEESQTRITVNWDEVYGAEGYYVRRWSSSNPDFSNNLWKVYSTSWIESFLREPGGTTYFFEITAFNETGKGQPSILASATVPFNKPIIGGVLRLSSNTISIFWQDVLWATEYDVERSTISASGPYELVETLTNPVPNEFTGNVVYEDNGVTPDSPNITYYYRVTARNQTGISMTSDPVGREGPAPIIRSVTISPNITSIGLGQTQQFNAIVDSNTGTTPPVTWQVRGVMGSPDCSSSISANGLLTVPWHEKAGTLLITATARLQNGATNVGYTYITIPPAVIPSSPTNVTWLRDSAHESGHSITLKWDPVTEAGVYGYEVVCNDTSGSDDSSKYFTGTQCTYSGLNPNTPYSFSVIALGVAGESAPSAPINTTTGLSDRYRAIPAPYYLYLYYSDGYEFFDGPSHPAEMSGMKIDNILLEWPHEEGLETALDVANTAIGSATAIFKALIPGGFLIPNIVNMDLRYVVERYDATSGGWKRMATLPFAQNKSFSLKGSVMDAIKGGETYNIVQHFEDKWGEPNTTYQYRLSVSTVLRIYLPDWLKPVFGSGDIIEETAVYHEFTVTTAP